MANGDGFTLKEIVLRLEDKVDKVLEDHETRLRGLERWRWMLVGATSVLATSLGVVTTLLS